MLVVVKAALKFKAALLKTKLLQRVAAPQNPISNFIGAVRCGLRLSPGLNCPRMGSELSTPQLLQSSTYFTLLSTLAVAQQ